MRSQYSSKTPPNLQPTQIPLNGRAITHKKNIWRYTNSENQQSLEKANIGEALHNFTLICSEINGEEC
jgi:hypothetical protein